MRDFELTLSLQLYSQLYVKSRKSDGKMIYLRILVAINQQRSTYLFS